MPVPFGTVAVLFTDIEGRAKLAREHADIRESLRPRHNEILHEAIKQDHGFFFKSSAMQSVFRSTNRQMSAGHGSQVLDSVEKLQ